MLKTITLAAIGLLFAASSASACEWMKQKNQSVKAPTSTTVASADKVPPQTPAPVKK